MVEKLGGKKFIATMTALLMAYTLALLGKLTGEFVTVVSISVGAFAVSNAYISGKYADRKVKDE